MNPRIAAPPEQSEAAFAELVDAIAADPNRRDALCDLLCEEHPSYKERNIGEIIRMRGWVLLAMARGGLTERELPFVLEEFDTGTDAYLVGAAAHAMVTYKHPASSFAPYVMHALVNVREEPLSFESYGEYATSSTGTTLVRELFTVLRWLGPHARATLPQLASMRAQPGKFSKKLIAELDRTVSVIASAINIPQEETDSCCTFPKRLGQSWSNSGARTPIGSVDSILFEDQDGEAIRFQDLFCGSPTIAVFFYTRCDNPWKCSLTVTKLARVQQLLKERGIANQINTVAVTYDSAFDLPERLRAYGIDRGFGFDRHNRMLRTEEGFATLKEHLNLGVNFVESLVNRHRIELYILDASGRVAARFERVHWEESQVVDRATDLLRESVANPGIVQYSEGKLQTTASTSIGTLASIGWAFFPKCPACWAAYLSAFGLTGVRQIQSPSAVRPALAAAMLINIVSVWIRARSTRRMAGFHLVCAGTLTIAVARMTQVSDNVATFGILLIFSGSLYNAVSRKQLQSCQSGLKSKISEFYLVVKSRVTEILRRQSPYLSAIYGSWRSSLSGGQKRLAGLGKLSLRHAKYSVATVSEPGRALRGTTNGEQEPA